MLTKINPYKTFYLSFASVWLVAVLSNMALGLFQGFLLFLDSMGVVLLVHDTHPEVTKAIDPEDDENNFFKNDRGVRLLIVLGAVIYTVQIVLLVHGDVAEEVEVPGAGSAAIKTVVGMFGFLPSGILGLLGFSLVYSWVVGLYMYLREPEVGGVLHRSLARILGLFEDAHDIRRLERSLSGEEKRRHVRAGRILLSQIAVGALISIVVFSISVLVFIVLSAPVITVVAILLWMAYEATGSRRKTELFTRLDEVTEAPQRLLFDFEVMEAGFKGVFVVMYVVLTFVFPIWMLSVFVGLSGRTFALARAWMFGGALLEPTAALAVLPLLSFLLVGVILCVYSFVVSYSFLNRLSVWLSDRSSQTEKTVPDLPKAMSLIYPIAFFLYFGALLRAVSFVSDSLEQPDTIAYVLGTVVVAASPFYVTLLYDAYRRAKTRPVRELSSIPENDYYRIPLVLSTQYFALLYLASFVDYGLVFTVYVICMINLTYLIPWFLSLCDRRVSSELWGSLLGDTYLLSLSILAFVSANAVEPEVVSLWEAAVISGILGGLLYSSSLVDNLLFK